jgi:hypothetical protein
MGKSASIKPLDPEELLYRINSGEPVSDEEFAQIAEALEAHGGPEEEQVDELDDIYAHLKVLGKAKLQNYRYLLERYLDSKDPFIVSMVLETLCLEWEDSASCLERVVRFAVGVGWDEEEDVRLTAIKVMGEHLRTPVSEIVAKGEGVLPPAETHVIELLISVFEDDTSEQWTRQGAYYALLRAKGVDWENIPSECAMLDLNQGSKDIDWKMLENLRELARTSAAGGFED